MKLKLSVKSSVESNIFFAQWLFALPSLLRLLKVTLFGFLCNFFQRFCSKRFNMWMCKKQAQLDMISWTFSRSRGSMSRLLLTNEIDVKRNWKLMTSPNSVIRQGHCNAVPLNYKLNDWFDCSWCTQKSWSKIFALCWLQRDLMSNETTDERALLCLEKIVIASIWTIFIL